MLPGAESSGSKTRQQISSVFQGFLFDSISTVRFSGRSFHRFPTFLISFPASLKLFQWLRLISIIVTFIFHIFFQFSGCFLSNFSLTFNFTLIYWHIEVHWLRNSTIARSGFLIDVKCCINLECSVYTKCSIYIWKNHKKFGSYFPEEILVYAYIHPHG